MKTVGVFDAKSRLSELIDGDEIVVITKHGKPVATLTPMKASSSAAA
jgi:prevent-host-death family protein